MATPTPKPDLTVYDLYEELGRVHATLPDEVDYKRMAGRQQLELEAMHRRHKDEREAYDTKVAKAFAKAKDLKAVIVKVLAGENPLVAYMAIRGTGE